MKNSTDRFKFAPALLAFAYTSSALAATQLPYFGPDQANCHVETPSNEYQKIDAGFVPSEDCSYIYVLPPTIGRLKTLAPAYSLEASNSCENFKQVTANLRTVSETPGDPNYASAVRRAEALANTYLTTLRETYPGAHAYASGTATLDWSGLVKAYQFANPHLSSQFVPMPIRVGVLSMTSHAGDLGTSEESDLELYSVRVASYRPPASTPSLGGSDGLPPYLSFLEKDKSSYLMGQAVGLSLRFGIMGACALRDQKNLTQTISGTYTYVYPVQSKGLVRYEFNNATIVPLIRDFILANRDGFTTDQLSEKIRQSKAFNVVINEGAFSDERIADQLEEFKKDLSVRATEIMLNLLASQSSIALKKATWIETTHHTSRECSGALFWKRCKTHSWYTQTEHVDWERFASDLTTHLSIPDISGQSYKTFYMISTSAMSPQEPGAL